MISKIVPILFVFVVVISCGSSNSELELENAKLKLQIYEDSIRRLNKSSQVTSDSVTLNSFKTPLEIQINWLQKIAFTNTKIKFTSPDNRTITKTLKLEKNGLFNIYTTIINQGVEKTTSIISGNLEYLDFLHSEIIPSEQGDFFVRIPCQSKRFGEDCIQGMLKNEKNYDEVWFGPYEYDNNEMKDIAIRDTLANVISGLMEKRFEQ